MIKFHAIPFSYDGVKLASPLHNVLLYRNSNINVVTLKPTMWIEMKLQVTDYYYLGFNCPLSMTNLSNLSNMDFKKPI